MRACWKNKTVFITGANSGIGLALVKDILNGDGEVIAFYRSQNNELESLASDALLLTKGDVTSRESVANAIKNGIKKFEKIDVVINNAGSMFYMDIAQANYDQMKTMIETNCFGFINLVQEMLPVLLNDDEKHWINITSDAGIRPFPGLAIYSGTKAFVEFSANAMRQELMKHKVKVTNIQPGNVNTPLHDKSTAIDAIKNYATLNSGQYLSTSDIVEAINFAVATPFKVAVNSILIEPFTESI